MKISTFTVFHFCLQHWQWMPRSASVCTSFRICIPSFTVLSFIVQKPCHEELCKGHGDCQYFCNASCKDMWCPFFPRVISWTTLITKFTNSPLLVICWCCVSSFSNLVICLKLEVSKTKMLSNLFCLLAQKSTIWKHIYILVTARQNQSCSTSLSSENVQPQILLLI